MRPLAPVTRTFGRADIWRSLVIDRHRYTINITTCSLAESIDAPVGDPPARGGELKRVLIVGSGGIGRRHLKGYGLTGRAELAIVEPDAERRSEAARLFGITEAYAGIADADFEIRDIRKDVKKGETPATPIFDFRAGVKIIVRNLANWRAVVGPLLDKPHLDGFMTLFDTTQRQQVEAELMGDAIKKATFKAQALAAGFGRKLGPVTAVTSGELKNLTRSMNLAASDSRYSPSQQASREKSEMLMIVSIKMGQPVDVIFRLK